MSRQVNLDSWSLLWMGKMERELQWWKGQLAADIHQSLRIKVRLLLLSCFIYMKKTVNDLQSVTKQHWMYIIVLYT